jgi:hypothetical protein
MDLVELAESLRDRGMSLATDAQEAKAPLWSERAYAALLRVARRQEKLFTDDVRRELQEDPAHYNCWGSIYMRAIRDGVITRTAETRHSAIPSLHRHRYTVYASNIYGRPS